MNSLAKLWWYSTIIKVIVNRDDIKWDHNKIRSGTSDEWLSKVVVFGEHYSLIYKNWRFGTSDDQS